MGAGLGYLTGRSLDDDEAFEHSKKKNNVSSEELNRPNKMFRDSYNKYSR